MQFPRIVTIIGGGGKTSLLYYLLTVVKEIGWTAIGTSTTKLSSHCLSGASFFTIKSIEGVSSAQRDRKIKRKSRF